MGVTVEEIIYKGLLKEEEEESIAEEAEDEVFEIFIPKDLKKHHSAENRRNRCTESRKTWTDSRV